ncbi:peptide/nickel transport system ATP-binding protein [Chitinivorax tropicus]|uniref:Peptide/nickel transport system ATP-binding protein n=1 Tax=Chitinivorax tropicus TaxID=714531 RepID=A0A840MUR9_9PROT|nr:dipeptide ABC transporter ATP-binding protein [Chitinivorax tropicus]MBB5020106.1 peptide/nickel transport system ATP-binding protein [Chitinivorax tropicus]
MSNEALLEVRDLKVEFKLGQGQIFTALKGVSFTIPKNSVVALVGESGSGKSVSAMAVMDLLPHENTVIAPESRLIFEGKNLLDESRLQRRDRCGDQMSMIFQEPMSSLNPVYTVGSQIAEVLRLHKGMSKSQAMARVIELLREVGIPDPERRVNSYPHEMSGGQQQRVMIAMAIACEPKLLIADEPTTALDVTIQKQIVELLMKLRETHGMSILFITHDLGLVKEIADHVVVMHHGVIKEQGPAAQVFTDPKDKYTRALLACRPTLDRRPVRLPVVDDFLQGREDQLPKEERARGVSESDPIVLEVKGLRKVYTQKRGLFGKHEIPAVQDVSFKLRKGKTLGVVGESGSGKTTMGKAVLRLHSAQGGEVMYDGKNLLQLSEKEFQPYKKKLQIIFQNPYASLNPRFTIGQILTEPMQIHGIGANDDERRATALGLLKRVGLDERAFGKYPHEFSGGQRQRIGIARCLTLKPEIIVCDESVSALDVSVQAQVLNLLQELQDEYGMSYIFISHDLSVVKYISDEVLVMNQGQMVEYGNSDAIYHDPQHDYTKKLLSAIPGKD